MKNIFSSKASVFNLSVFSVLFVPALLAGFLLAPSVQASTYSKIISQSSGPACYYNFNGYGEAKSGQSFTATSTNLISLGLMISPYSTISEIKICEGDFSSSQASVSTDADWNCDNPGQKPLLSFKPDSSNTFYSPATGWTDFDFPFPITSKIGQKYFALFRISGTNICPQYWNDNYPNGQARAGGFDITDFTFNIYSTPDLIDWSVATPDKVSDLKVDDYYSSGHSAKLNWTTPNTYQSSSTSTYEIEYWPKIYNCQTDYGFGGIPGAKKQTGEYTVGSGQKSEAVIKDLNKNSGYCLAITSSNQFNKSELSNFIEVNTNDSDLIEDVDQKNDADYPNTINVNVPMILAQTFIPQKDNISSLELLVKSQNSAIGYIGEVRLCKGKATSSPRGGVFDIDWNCQGRNQELIATTTIDKSLLPNENSSLAWVRIPFSSIKKLIPEDDYFFSFFGYKIIVGADFNNEGAYPKGWATGANVADLSFRTFFSTQGDVNANKTRVAVILVDTKDAKHVSSSITAQPCKLIPEKIYLNGHDKEYYEDLFYCVKDYHCENSFGKMNEQGDCDGGLVDLDFEFYYDGDWQYIDKNIKDYRSENGKPIKEFNFLNDLSESFLFDNDKSLKFFISPGSSKHFGGYFDTLARGDGKVLFAEDDGVYFAAHEISHLLGLFFTPEDSKTPVPDLYKMGEAQGWDIMHNAGDSTLQDPMFMSSYTKEFLRWFNYDIHAKSDFGDYWIEYLEEKGYGESVFRYNLENSNSDSVQKYYIIEARNKDLKKWDSSIPSNKVVVLYYVDENGADEYGISSDSKILNGLRTVSIPGSIEMGPLNINGGVLDPLINQTFRDFDKLVKVTAKNVEDNGGKGGINVSVGDMTEKDLSDKFWGWVLDDNTKIIREASLASFDGAGYVSDQDINKKSRKLAISMIPSALVLLGLSLLFFLFYKIISRKNLKNVSLNLIRGVMGFVFIILMSIFILFVTWIIAMSISHSNSKFFDPGWLFHVPSEQDFSSYKTEGLRNSVARGQAMTMVPFASIVFLIDLACFLFLVFFIKKNKWGALKKRVVEVFLIVFIVFLTLLFAAIMFLIVSLSLSYKNFKNLKYLEGVSALAHLTEGIVLPDTDLHLYCNDGRHVGINYETGKYEIDIPEAQTIGDAPNSREWIFVPAEYKNTCHFVVSSKDTKTFIEKNPEIASEIGVDNLQNKYDLYARYIDPENGINTSEKITGELNPGDFVEYVAQSSDGGITKPSYTQFDITFPTTTISIFGQKGDNEYYVSAVQVELVASDGVDGAGILKTQYSLDGGNTWNKYENKISITGDGEYQIMYYSTDKVGNPEEYKETTIKIDQTAPEITMLTPQEGQEIGRHEKLNIEYLAEDVFSGLVVDGDEIYFDNEKIASREIDLFNKGLGERTIKIVVKDRAGNQARMEIKFSVVMSMTGAIADINRLYLEKLINQKAKDALINDLEDVQKYLDKNAKKEEKKQEVEKEIRDKCIAKKGQSWCEEKLGNVFQKIDYHLSQAQQKIVQVKYELIIKKLEIYEKIGWITRVGGGIIREDVKYLLNKL